MAAAYRALVSSDWNQCLAPSGPFDIIAYLYPYLKPDLDTIFRQYTGNRISLSKAMDQIAALLPEPVSQSQMDDYLRDNFTIYPGVADFARRCHQEQILFMINTTAIIGYFQRAAAIGLILPPVVLSAHPLVRYAPDTAEPEIILPLLETTDKSKNTRDIAARFGIPAQKVIIIGDSGGDGPHFEWGASIGAFLIGSMTKPSLIDYCDQRRIHIHHFFGHTYTPGEFVSTDKEQGFDFTDLWPVIEEKI